MKEEPLHKRGKENVDAHGSNPGRLNKRQDP